MQYWVIAPYDSTVKDTFEKVWEHNLKDGNISLGWSQLGDVSKLSKEELLEKINRDLPDSKQNNALKCLWSFYHDIQIGDTVIARKGVKRIIGIGVVKGEAYYDVESGKVVAGEKGKDRFNPHFRKIEWKKANIILKDQAFGRTALQKISEDKINAILNRGDQGKQDRGVNNHMSDLLSARKQIILYGPPGTGKTYIARRVAVNFLKSK